MATVNQPHTPNFCLYTYGYDFIYYYIAVFACLSVYVCVYVAVFTIAHVWNEAPDFLYMPSIRYTCMYTDIIINIINLYYIYIFIISCIMVCNYVCLVELREQPIARKIFTILFYFFLRLFLFFFLLQDTKDVKYKKKIQQ